MMLVVVFTATASAQPHRATTDGQPVAHHVHRAHALINRAYSHSRWRDSTPAKGSEKRAWQSHRHAILLPNVRQQIGHFRDSRRRLFDQYRASQLEVTSIDPPGAAYLAGLRACESGGNYATDTGNGFYGAYQFDLGTWASIGGSGNPAAASPAEQDYRAALLWRARGSAPWPVCG
jgi:hypothetical protein